MSNPAKQREFENWTEVTPGWARHDERLRVSLNPVSERMLDAIELREGQEILDIASGTGEPALLAAERVGPGGRVLGTDFVEGMLELARHKAAARGLRNAEFRRVDGEELDAAPGSFDAVLIRWGIMFMPDPQACLARAHAALRPGGRIAVACWGPPDRNPWAALPIAVLKRHMEVPTPPPGAPGLFSFADPARLRGALETAGFTGVAVDDVSVEFGGPFDDGASFVTFTTDIAGPIARLFGKLPDEKRREVIGEVARECESRRSGGKIVLPGSTWLAHARRA